MSTLTQKFPLNHLPGGTETFSSHCLKGWWIHISTCQFNGFGCQKNAVWFALLSLPEGRSWSLLWKGMKFREGWKINISIVFKWIESIDRTNGAMMIWRFLWTEMFFNPFWFIGHVHGDTPVNMLCAVIYFGELTLYVPKEDNAAGNSWWWFY